MSIKMKLISNILSKAALACVLISATACNDFLNEIPLSLIHI